MMKSMASPTYVDLNGLCPMLNIVSPFEISVINQVNWNIYVDHEGPSGVMRDDLLLPDPPLDYQAPSLPNDDAGVERNLDAKVYGLSNLSQSQRIVSHVEHSKSLKYQSSTKLIIFM